MIVPNDKEAKKLIRQAKRKNPSSIVAVIGCYAQLKPKEIDYKVFLESEPLIETWLETIAG